MATYCVVREILLCSTPFGLLFTQPPFFNLTRWGDAFACQKSTRWRKG